MHRRRGIPLVCRRWRRVFYSEPMLWRKFEALRFSSNAGCCEEEARGRLALLRSVAPVVAVFSWFPGSGSAAIDDSLPAFMAALQPSRLEVLSLRGMKPLAAEAVAGLHQYTRLTHLRVESCSPGAALQAAPQLPASLRSLELNGSFSESDAPLVQLMGRLPQLQQLTELILSVSSIRWPPL